MRSDKLKLDEVKAKIPADFDIVEYNGYGKKSIFIHNVCGVEFDMRIDHLINRGKCVHCDHRKRTFDRFQIESNSVHNNEYEILEFVAGNDPVKIKHLLCGSIFYQKGYSHLKGHRCDVCYGNVKLSKEDIIRESKKKWGEDFTIISEDVEYTKMSKIRHNKCGNILEQIVSNHLVNGSCAYCANNKKHDKNSIQLKSNEVHNDSYIIISDKFKNVKSKIDIQHMQCGRTFKQTISEHLTGCGCPFCNLSKGELFIQKFLEDNNINHIRQATFDRCIYKKKLRFDFYIPDINICIEYDGQQHFRPVHWFGGKPAYEIQLVKDSIKTDFCLNNNMELIRFKFSDSEEFINDKLKQIFNI